MEPDPPLLFTFFSSNNIAFTNLLLDSSFLLSLLSLIILIVSSALISGSEVAFFGLSPSNLRTLEEDKASNSKRIISLREKPRKLLATILIANNFINIAIIIVSQYIIEMSLRGDSLASISTWINVNFIFDFLTLNQISNGINFLLTIVLVTFILVLFGEVAPKIYANINPLRFSKLMSSPVKFLSFIFSPLSKILVGWGEKIENKISSSRSFKTGTSKEDLDAAIEITVSKEKDSEQEADILKGIIKFGDVSARQIMKSRMDVVALDIETSFIDIMEIAKNSGYSRLPVFKEDFDNIKGILYVKDLLGYTKENKDFEWQKLIRENTIYTPESKKIDDLLREFQRERIHMAIVVNEFGGSLGIITLEDIMEEVIGDIKDEFDHDDEIDFIKIDDNNYIFEGRTLLNDVCRVVDEKTGYFDDIKGNADSLAGLIIEQLGTIPRPESEVKVKNITLKVITVTNRRIEKVNLKKIN